MKAVSIKQLPAPIEELSAEFVEEDDDTPTITVGVDLDIVLPSADVCNHADISHPIIHATFLHILIGEDGNTRSVRDQMFLTEAARSKAMNLGVDSRCPPCSEKHLIMAEALETNISFLRQLSMNDSRFIKSAAERGRILRRLGYTYV